MAGTPREAPAWFVARLRQYPDFVELRFNEQLERWEFVFLSAANKPVSQFYGRQVNPFTGERIAPDPVTGLLPFRDLDDTACGEILKSLDETFIGRREGPGTWRRQAAEANAFNRAAHERQVAQRADDFAYAIQQVDIRRPWMTHHGPRAPKLMRKHA